MCLESYSHYSQSVRSSLIDIKMSIIFKLAKFKDVMMLRMSNE